MAIGRSNSSSTLCPVTLLSLISMVSLSYQSDTILPGQSVHANQTITSRGGIFELGFFSYGNSSKFYAGIWYKRIPTLSVVWIANRDTPIHSSAKDGANLILTGEGNLQLQVDGQIVWTTNTATTDLNRTEAVLLDSGNLIVGSDSSPNMWESFNYPTNTWLPGAKIGLDMTTGKTYPTILTSWRHFGDPGSGTYSLGIDLSGSSQLLLWHNKTYKMGSIGASDFSGVNLESKLNITFNVSRTNGVNYATYFTLNNSIPIRMMLDYNGLLRQETWNEKRARWLTLWVRPEDYCESYATCGSNGICSTNHSPSCSCPEGFQPKDISDWELGDHSAGCVRRSGSRCFKDKDRFAALDNIRWPHNYQFLSVGSAEACRSACAADCSCSAYSNIIGCYLWFGELLKMERPYDMTSGETLFLRLDSNEQPEKGAKKSLWIPLAPSIALPILVFGSLCYYLYRKKIIKGVNEVGQDLLLFDLEMVDKRHTNQVNIDLDRGNRDLTLPIFSLSSVLAAANNFSSSNKLGEGGFGPVNKGKLHNGEEVAVKRLSKHSGQGLEELINEAKLIAKLQHTNLVRLLGCCIQQDEKILIYEYMPNKSLDSFLFYPIKKQILNWSGRIRIIEGIAQGLLYLHHYSRLRIVHRDLKTSNILLDVDLKPKISDFGMARIFGGNQLQANTKHIVGTFGYMPPEYALHGLFSVKTDIFSFGVLLLEILSGEKNISFHHEDCLNLLGYAWMLWTNGTPLELIDPIVKSSCDLSTALRYVHLGLLCVQEHPDNRPSILDIVAMIGNEKKIIEVQPKQPAYLVGRRALEVNPERFSLNELTYSTMQPR